ncbi:indolepyruvate ferredoxin oxidoreductase subunit alpha [Clostridium thermopalmarium]|uniref:Indolepyruvate oxidoreductase subunit IorA n=1 Tax=Clostridium thermopalmarium DSM 5974 TaxID=1121340 RepID=A0A2T0ARB6_9CLOT|nr:indolepyruvate ferredoxin oxidoreductase subunit alpha [Clostridium thermopalmarium]PRR72050.1 indolepyruvate ferredoxin oxidoreductase [Clostridium thermopalmarium DSM 5974]PVZ23702.1 indolepyruvate ferredoxin oxidoreductase alpha subunit [Clostridium thermopalmarium DSM 5974]
MAVELLMGNEAIAMGAIHSGVGIVTGYPGTPSTEIIETVAKKNPGDVYVEWSVNEKSALEVAAGAAYAGMRAMVTMKQVGLNVASDPLMSLSYIGVKGGMVIVVADDPGPISSQTEQDTRHFAAFSKLPVFDPSSPEEAYHMIGDAFEYSEKYNIPVLLRPTTRVCHGYAAVEVSENIKKFEPEGFVKDPKWAIFPALSYKKHLKIEEMQSVLMEDFSKYTFNSVTGSGRKGIATGGVSYAYTCEALSNLKVNLQGNLQVQQGQCKVFKVATPNPFPEKLALEFLKDIDEVLVIEELDPVIEKQLIYLCGKHNLKVKIMGKGTNHIQKAGENTVQSVTEAISKFLNVPAPELKSVLDLPVMPVRPPVLCAGCPHRASFYAVKQAMKGRKAVFSGDIGCYTLGNAKPLEMVDTCLCMGAGITIAQGLHRVEPDIVNFAFIGDSTFFHTGIPGVVNAVYNGTDIVIIVLDNSNTAMTGNQPNPATGKTAMGSFHEKISISNVLKALGVKYVKTINPFDLEKSIEAVKEAADFKGVSAVIFESPCIAVTPPLPLYAIDKDKCTGCKKCIREIGCPAIVKDEDKVKIDESLCNGCSLCVNVCPFDAIGGEN